jgi:beta-glucosidase
MSRIIFPPDFLWGTATSSYQVEGAWDSNGKGLSIWDTFVRVPGRIRNEATGDVACDHFHRYLDDVKLMKGLKLKAYRFSLSWPRILPTGKGRVNQEGLDFYSRLVDTLLEADIEPMITLYHWDLPQSVEYAGGWANRDIAVKFGDYAFAAAGHLGDRVKLWTTLNEPQIFTYLGYYLGVHAPGVKDRLKYFLATHAANLAHGAGVQAIRSEVPEARVGIVLACSPIHPAADSRDDENAASVLDGLMNRWFADPILSGHYPQDMLRILAPLDLSIEEKDLEKIHQPLDFVGLNIYTRHFAARDPRVPLLEARFVTGRKVSGVEYTDMGWEIYPPAVSEILLRFKEEWGDPEIYLTENGAAFDDHLVSGRIDDQKRIRFYQDYLAELRRAMDQGAKVRGFFAWSFLDNFEWTEGFSKRFGIVYVDFESLDRTPKASAHWYQNVIEENGFDLPEE